MSLLLFAWVAWLGCGAPASGAPSAAAQYVEIPPPALFRRSTDFNASRDCGGGAGSAGAEDASFLGPLRTLTTGAVDHSYWRFRRSGCGAQPLTGRSLSQQQQQQQQGSCPGAASGPSSARGCSAAGEPTKEEPALVLIHGYGSTLQHWGLTTLAELGCRLGREVILAEHRGMGASVDRDASPLTVHSMAAATVDFIAALGLPTKPDVLGVSMGGAVALTIAAEHGDSVGRVVAFATWPGSRHAVPVNYAILEGRFDGGPSANPPTFQEDAMRVALGDTGNPSFAADACASLRAMAALPAQPINGTTVARQLAAIRAYADDDSVWEALPAVRNRVLLVTGTEDALIPAGNSALAAARIPGSWLVQLPGMAHGIGPRQLPRFLDLLDLFLSD